LNVTEAIKQAINDTRCWHWRTGLLVFTGFALMCACTETPSWQKLLSLKITEHYPSYKVQTTGTGGLVVERPGKSPLPIDADAIGRFCQRGVKDCNYATDQMLLQLGDK
jgi:hypothetical protein